MNKVIFCIFAVVVSGFASAHEGHHKKTSAETDAEKLKAINEAYVQSVKPIFQKSCFDCHSSTTRYPWYSNLPLVSQLIANDLKEAKEHLDMSHDFPFSGHGTPLEDLKAISSELSKGDMPPVRYWLMHPSAKVSEQERKTINEWIQNSTELLK